MWLAAQQVESVSWSDPLPWLFSFSRGARLTVECPWRIIAEGHIAVSSEDHGQQYGLPAPIDLQRLLASGSRPAQLSTYESPRTLSTC
jgi:hypothetical protein